MQVTHNNRGISTQDRQKSRLYPTHIEIPAPIRSQVVKVLNQTLATTLDLKTQVKLTHWNVKGMEFYQLHEIFDEIATELDQSYCAVTKCFFSRLM